MDRRRKSKYLTDAGFLLSFGAILGILLLSGVSGNFCGEEEGAAGVGRKSGDHRISLSGHKLFLL